ncbi:hypothetical protein SPBR_04444 [Sporothrix brasiliensis 5110]|uniref:Cytochrome p450 protein n=1 Tax=Sporothrix brasiliensis 5110 TaxID=1398154 RepID=A0A0C2FQQ7_9PEZI|nr:uncharacterized protein SPBR_04444 [Sporothrix brasiliensis 5110]KIH93383.1 hypothetical protein SPBR_04444 [Sporothrix brasiliensis 5110]
MQSIAVLVGLLVAAAVGSPSGIAGKDYADRVARKRTAETVQLIAYGTNISGLPIYAGADDLAYVATPAAAALANLTALTWTIDTTGEDAWTVAPSTNASTVTPGSLFYIVSSSERGDAFDQAGFVPDASDAPAGATTTGFIAYGPYVIVAADKVNGTTSYVSEFWARTAPGTDGLWALMWNEANKAHANSAPLSIKTTAPVKSTV